MSDFTSAEPQYARCEERNRKPDISAERVIKRSNVVVEAHVIGGFSIRRIVFHRDHSATGERNRFMYASMTYAYCAIIMIIAMFDDDYLWIPRTLEISDLLKQRSVLLLARGRRGRAPSYSAS
jgi:hypothetical protein